MWQERYKDCLAYIDTYWDKIILNPHKGTPYWKKLLLRRVEQKLHKNAITIPHAFLVPNDKKFNYAFYWDTFFMFRGLIQTKREWILKDMIDNFVYLFKTYDIIPNFNAPVSMGRSQPPFFTSMILDTYNGYYFAYLRNKGLRRIFFRLWRHKKWLQKITAFAKQEYWSVWIDKDGFFNHSVPGYILNRYGDRDIGYAHSSELESGWDFTSRFYNRCNDFLPIDLNVFLFKYERDFAKVAYHLEDTEEETFWKERAEQRKKEINRLLWDEDGGFFFDYGYAYKRRSNFLSLAGFTPLWAGLASKQQAEAMRKKLPVFETEHGLVITAKESLAPKINLAKIPLRFQQAIKEIIEPKQWDYPHIWPPLEYLTVVGLLKYGFVEDAKRIMEKSVKTHGDLFRKYQTFFEKINGVTGDKPKHFHYLSQTGFGWTNAVFYRYIQILDALEQGREIYAQPKAKTPPFKLAIAH